jgi:heme/copper-type cytochrome/quinol oxidase subunit 3
MKLELENEARGRRMEEKGSKKDNMIWNLVTFLFSSVLMFQEFICKLLIYFRKGQHPFLNREYCMYVPS